MIIVRMWEGLGNQLFQYAFARAYALKTGQVVKLDTERIFEQLYTEGNVKREYALNGFSITIEKATIKDLEKYNFMERRTILQKTLFLLAKCGLWKYSFWEESIENFSPEIRYSSGNRYLKGWFQNEKYFSKYRSILLKELTPKRKIVIPRELRELLDTNNTVSLHIRRGDYKKIGAMLSMQYYINAYQWMQNTNPQCTYLVFSDDLKWAKENLEFIDHKYFVNERGTLKDYEELMIMSKCHHNIIANSTFSWWGAWLNKHPDKIVIAPKRWFIRNPKEEEDINITPKEWKRI